VDESHWLCWICLSPGDLGYQKAATQPGEFKKFTRLSFITVALRWADERLNKLAM